MRRANPGSETERNQRFIDALREYLGLAPLCGESAPPPDVVRFAGRTYSNTPWRNDGRPT